MEVILGVKTVVTTGKTVASLVLGIHEAYQKINKFPDEALKLMKMADAVERAVGDNEDDYTIEGILETRVQILEALNAIKVFFECKLSGAKPAKGYWASNSKHSESASEVSNRLYYFDEFRKLTEALSAGKIEYAFLKALPSKGDALLDVFEYDPSLEESLIHQGEFGPIHKMRSVGDASSVHAVKFVDVSGGRVSLLEISALKDMPSHSHVVHCTNVLGGGECTVPGDALC